MGLGLGAKAKTFIHSIDSLDAEREPLLSPTELTSTVRVQYFSAAASENTITVPPGSGYWVYGITIQNDKRDSRAQISIRTDASTTTDKVFKSSLSNSGVAISSGANRPAAIEGLRFPFFVGPGCTIRFADLAYQAGDTITSFMMWYEVKI